MQIVATQRFDSLVEEIVLNFLPHEALAEQQFLMIEPVLYCCSDMSTSHPRKTFATCNVECPVVSVVLATTRSFRAANFTQKESLSRLEYGLSACCNVDE